MDSEFWVELSVSTTKARKNHRFRAGFKVRLGLDMLGSCFPKAVEGRLWKRSRRQLGKCVSPEGAS